jgi:L-amino acid N-acyltransferase YncA
VTAPVIRDVQDDDCAAIARIYNHYIASTTITFEEEPVDGPELARRVHEVTAGGHPWLVLEVDGAVAGYAYAAAWHKRSAYRFTVESTVYLDPARTGRGVGARLYTALLERLRAQSVHAVIGVIALPNPASVALHERLGFAVAGRIAQVGFKHGRWIDVGYWQKVFGS